MVRELRGDGPAVLREELGAPADQRPVIVVYADERRATVYRCRFATIDRVETVRVYHRVNHPLRVAVPEHPDRTGMLSVNSRAAAPANAASGRVRMLTETLRRIRDLGGDDAWIVLCGVRRVVAPLTQQLDTLTPSRVIALDWLDPRPTDAEVLEAAREGVATLRIAAHRRPIQTTGALAKAGRCVAS